MPGVNTIFTGGFAVRGAAVAVGLALTAFATPASALTEIKLTRAEMDTTYRAYVLGRETISNGITFDVTETVSGASYELFAFCVDIYHSISLGPLNLTYLSNKGDPGEPLTTNFAVPTPTLLSDAQKARVSSLVDIGFLLNRDAPGAATSLQTAAIQAAIWETLNPGAVSLKLTGLSAAQSSAYAGAYTYYRTADFGPVDRIFTLVPKAPGNTQRFAVGWPIEGGVPEPGTWAIMLIGFFSVGGVVRRRRAIAA